MSVDAKITGSYSISTHTHLSLTVGHEHGIAAAGKTSEQGQDDRLSFYFFCLKAKTSNTIRGTSAFRTSYRCRGISFPTLPLITRRFHLRSDRDESGLLRQHHTGTVSRRLLAIL